MPSTLGAQYQFINGVWRGLNGVPDIAPIDTPPPPPPGTTAVPPTFVANAGVSASTGAIRPIWPSGHAAGDIGLLIVESANDVMALLDAQGFVEVTGSPVGTGTASGAASTRLHVYWCRAVSSTMPSPQVGFSTTGDHVICRIVVFRGVIATGNPWDVTAADVLASAATAATIPGLTTTLDQCLIVNIIAWATEINTGQWSGETNASLTSLTERADSGSVSGNGGGSSVVTGIKATLGAVSATTGTLATSSVQARMTLALKPVPGSTAPPPDTEGTFRTMVGAFSVPEGLRGFDGGTPAGGPFKPTPDVKFSHGTGSAWVGPSGHIQHARDNGYCIIAQVTEGSQGWADPITGDFSPTIWNALFDTWSTGVNGQGAWNNGTYAYTGGADELSKAVKDGVMRGIMVIDDFVAPKSGGNANGFAHAVPFESIENISEHVKSIYPYLPCIARGVCVYLRDAAKVGGTQRQYRWLDAGWSQWRSSADAPRPGPLTVGTQANYNARALAYVNTQVQAGIECGLTCIGGANILNRGDGLDPDWGYVQGDNPPPSPGGMGPKEIKAIGLTTMADPRVVGWVIWAYDGLGPVGDTYYNHPDILAALTEVYNASVGRFDPPINRRGDIAIPV